MNTEVNRKMVPSDSSDGLAPGLRAWPQALRYRRDGRFTSLCSPLVLFKAAGLRFTRASLVSPVRSRHLEAAFRSPVTTVRLRAAIAGSPFPTCFFNASLDRFQVRSACGSFADAGLRPALAPSSPPARCPDFNPSLPGPPRISASLWGSFVPSGSLRSIRFVAEKLAFRKPPDLPLLPVPQYRCRYRRGGC